MAVRLQRQSDVCMAHVAGYDFDRHTSSRRHGGVGITQIVQTHVLFDGPAAMRRRRNPCIFQSSVEKFRKLPIEHEVCYNVNIYKQFPLLVFGGMDANSIQSSWIADLRI